jgi:hypothetical protein
MRYKSYAECVYSKGKSVVLCKAFCNGIHSTLGEMRNDAVEDN